MFNLRRHVANSLGKRTQNHFRFTYSASLSSTAFQISNPSMKNVLSNTQYRSLSSCPSASGIDHSHCRSCRKDLSKQPDHPCNPLNQAPDLPDCKSCPVQNSPHRHLFCAHCGVIQPPDSSTYFERLGFPLSFDIDSNELDQSVKNLQRKVHPDRFCMKPQEDQDFSSEHSTQINLAHATLKDHLSRGRYIVSLVAPDLLSEDNSKPSSMELLMEVLEVREELEDAAYSKDFDKLITIYQENETKKIDSLPGISEAFEKKDYVDMVKQLDRLAYWYSIEHDLLQHIPNEIFEKYDLQPNKLT